jgi:hemoglobin-like flavoprotein
MVLVELLLDQAHGLIETRMPRRLGGTLAEHRALGIDGRHYSRFGDALVPILSDLLGPNVPREVPVAWCDAFWTIVRTIEPQRRRA